MTELDFLYKTVYLYRQIYRSASKQESLLERRTIEK